MQHLIQLIDIHYPTFPPVAIDIFGPPIVAPSKAQAIMAATETLLKDVTGVVSVDMTESADCIRICGLDEANTVIIGYMIVAEDYVPPEQECDADCLCSACVGHIG